MPVKNFWNSVNIWQRYGHICDVASLSTCSILSQTLNPSCAKTLLHPDAALGFHELLCVLFQENTSCNPPPQTVRGVIWQPTVYKLRVDYMAEVFQFSIRNYFSCFCANVRPVRGITSAKITLQHTCHITHFSWGIFSILYNFSPQTNKAFTQEHLFT